MFNPLWDIWDYVVHPVTLEPNVNLSSQTFAIQPLDEEESFEHMPDQTLYGQKSHAQNAEETHSEQTHPYGQSASTAYGNPMQTAQPSGGLFGAAEQPRYRKEKTTYVENQGQTTFEQTHPYGRNVNMKNVKAKRDFQIRMLLNGTSKPDTHNLADLQKEIDLEKNFWKQSGTNQEHGKREHYQEWVESELFVEDSYNTFDTGNSLKGNISKHINNDRRAHDSAIAEKKKQKQQEEKQAEPWFWESWSTYQKRVKEEVKSRNYQLNLRHDINHSVVEYALEEAQAQHYWGEAADGKERTEKVQGIVEHTGAREERDYWDGVEDDVNIKAAEHKAELKGRALLMNQKLDEEKYWQGHQPSLQSTAQRESKCDNISQCSLSPDGHVENGSHHRHCIPW